MILKKIRLKNIRSYKQAEIEFPEGSTLLMGDIGSGKTSVLLAVEFALFGLQPSQRGSSLLRNNEDEASVCLEFEIDNQKILIERKLKRTSKSITQTDAAITINNQRFEGAVTEIKNKVLSLLSYPPEFAKKTNDLYKFTVYTPQEEMKQIILEPSETRLNTLRHVFGIDKYKRVSENLDKLGIKLRQDIRIKEAKLGDISQKDNELQEKKQLLEEQHKKIREVESEIGKIRLSKEKKEQEIKELETKITEKNTLEREKEKLEVLLSHKKDMLQSHEKEILALSKQIEEGKRFSFDQEKFDALKTHIATQERFLKDNNDEFVSLSSKIQSRETKKSEVESLKNKIAGLKKCPTCLQEVNELYKSNIISNADKEIKLINEQNEFDKQKKLELNQKVEHIKKQIESYKNSLSEMQILKIKLESLKEKEVRALDIEKQKFNVAKEINITTDQIRNLANMIKNFEKYTQEYEQKDKELEEVQTKENKIMISKAEVNKEIQFLEQQIKKIKQEIKELNELDKKIQNLKELESWLSTKFAQLVSYTERNVMLKLREEFSQLFSEWFSVLVPEDLSASLDETFTPIIQQQDYEIDYQYLSGGEKTAVALAYRLALNQVINSLLSKIKTHDIVILDEPTDGFSEAQLDKMRDVFSQLKVKQLILVSHEQKIEGFVDSIIRFKKLEGITQVEK